jgi:hypothetical protein
MNLITVTEAVVLAQSRGQTVSAATVKHACADGKLPATLFGKTWAFTPADFWEWMDTGRPKLGRPKNTEKDTE